jgi:hypothetical protein
VTAIGTVRDPDYFMEKARQCFRLANACCDQEVTFKLRQLGLEFTGKAIELGADPKIALPSYRNAPDHAH